SSGGTNFEPPCSVVARTKSSIACLAGPSFHDPSELSCVGWVCAVAGKGRLDKAGSNARPEISTRRLMSDAERSDVIWYLLAICACPSGQSEPDRSNFSSIGRRASTLRRHYLRGGGGKPRCQMVPLSN